MGRWDSLKIKHERQGLDGLDMYWRKDDGYIGRWMLGRELPGNSKRGRPKRSFLMR